MDKWGAVDKINAGKAKAQEGEIARRNALQKVKRKIVSPRASSRKAVRSAGKQSAARGKYGMRIQILKNGKDMAGAARYAMQENNKQKYDIAKKIDQGLIYRAPKIIAGNCDNVDELIRAAAATKKFKPSIQKDIGHFVISFPAETNFDDARWNELVEDAMRGLDIPDGCPFLAIRHFDEPHPHVHVVFSRISFSGRVHDQTNLGYRASTVCKTLEKKYELNLFEPPPKSGINRQIKDEQEMMLRAGELSIKAKMQAICSDAMTNCNNITTYFERIEAAGISVHITMQEDDSRISGVVYKIGDVAMKASSLGKNFTAAGLSKIGVNYDKNRDLESIKRIENRGAVKLASEPITAAETTTDADSGRDSQTRDAYSDSNERVESGDRQSGSEPLDANAIAIKIDELVSGNEQRGAKDTELPDSQPPVTENDNNRINTFEPSYSSGSVNTDSTTPARTQNSKQPERRGASQAPSASANQANEKISPIEEAQPDNFIALKRDKIDRIRKADMRGANISADPILEYGRMAKTYIEKHGDDDLTEIDDQVAKSMMLKDFSDFAITKSVVRESPNQPDEAAAKKIVAEARAKFELERLQANLENQSQPRFNPTPKM